MSIRIGLLATGDEITTGDITNTNGPTMAHALCEVGYRVGLHVVASDTPSDIATALRWLLSCHDIVIITGGLGPTTDDRTRFALAEVIEQPLFMHEPSWQHIVQRLTYYRVPVTENNRQQALFPVMATVLVNENGTANGCKVVHSEQFIYLLPGPPRECLPIFNAQVLPDISSHFAATPRFKHKWRLFNVSESEIASQLEAALAIESVVTGYRIDYPYLEFKIDAPANIDSTALLAKLQPILQPHFLADEYLPASTVLKKRLLSLSTPLLIIDKATGGQLQAKLLDRHTRPHVYFTEELPVDTHSFAMIIEISGLAEYWQSLDNSTQTTLQLTYQYQGKVREQSLTLPYRVGRVLLYAVELIANQIINYLD